MLPVLHWSMLILVGPEPAAVTVTVAVVVSVIVTVVGQYVFEGCGLPWAATDPANVIARRHKRTEGHENIAEMASRSWLFKRLR
jgi:hypothetical protein